MVSGKLVSGTVPNVNKRGGRRATAVGAGRPRDPALDQSILAASRELLAEVGYEKTTITAIARRANIGTAAVYRRWSTKAAIVEDAVFGMQDASLPPNTGDLQSDVNAWTEWFLAQIAEPATRAAIPGLLSSYRQDEGAYERLVFRSEHPARVAWTRRAIDAYPGRDVGTVAAAADGAFDFLVAVTIVRGLTKGMIDAEEFCGRTAASLTQLIAGSVSGSAGN